MSASFASDGAIARGAPLGATTSGGVGATAVPLANSRMIWEPAKAAFRAGVADATEWDDANIGDYSVAMGQNTEASGAWAVAMGLNALAQGQKSLAIGNAPFADGASSVALGQQTQAHGFASAALNLERLDRP